MEKILRIEETNFKTKERSWGGFDGYQIITDQQTIQIGRQAAKNYVMEYGNEKVKS